MKRMTSRLTRMTASTLPAVLTSAALAADTPISPAQGSPCLSLTKLPPASIPAPLDAPPPSAEGFTTAGIGANIPEAGTVDTAPSAHPKEYQQFISQLNEIAKQNSYRFFPALITVLNATGDELAALDWMKQAAAEGNLTAIAFLANRQLSFVQLGQEMSQEVQKAYTDVRQAADAGYTPAVIPVVRCLRAGIGVKKNAAAGTKYLANACRSGDFQLRYLWLDVTDRLQSEEDQHRPEIKSELDRGNHYVALRLSQLSTLPADKLEWMRKAADMGNDVALLELSTLLVKQDAKAALTLLNAAVKLQNVDAFFSLGSTLLSEQEGNLLSSTGLARDEKTGTYLLRLAAMHGHQQALFMIGTMYQMGKFGLPRNEKHAYDIFCFGADQGNIGSSIMATYCQLAGIGTPQDLEKGNKKLDELVESGHPLAALVKAYTYYKGIGREPSMDRVTEYCILASGSGFPAAYVHLACILAKGMPGQQPDPERAENYVRMAELDMGPTARKLFDELMALPEWSPIFL